MSEDPLKKERRLEFELKVVRKQFKESEERCGVFLRSIESYQDLLVKTRAERDDAGERAQLWQDALRRCEIYQEVLGKTRVQLATSIELLKEWMDGSEPREATATATVQFIKEHVADRLYREGHIAR